MNNISNIKIKISETAYTKLLEMLQIHKEYSNVRLVYSSGCCKNSKIDLYLDNYKEGDIKDALNDIPILYSSSLYDTVNEITIIYKNSSFMIKTELKNPIANCSKGCNSNCSEKDTCSNCNSCSKNCGKGHENK